MSGISSDSLRAAAGRLASWRRPLLLTHTKPDGDAVGAMIAMHEILGDAGADPVSLVFDPVPARYQFLTKSVRPTRIEGNLPVPEAGEVDGVLVLDTCSYSQLAPAADWLRTTALPKVVLDHHATRDDLGATELIDDKASATCLLIHEWAQAAGWSITPDVAEALFAGIATDTGWFRHSNTDARTLAAVTDLVGRGAEPHALYERLFHQESQGRFRLRAAASSRVALSAGDRLAVIALPKGLFADCGATLADTEDLVNEPLRIESVVVSAMFVDQGDHVIRVGLRSKDPLDGAFPDIDVSAVAAAFGGGGHRRAAGVRLNGTLDSVRAEVTARLAPLLGR